MTQDPLRSQWLRFEQISPFLDRPRAVKTESPAIESAWVEYALARLGLTAGKPPTFPWAICRQSPAEFDRGKILILSPDTTGKIRETRFADLYPEMFGFQQL